MSEPVPDELWSELDSLGAAARSWLN